MELPHTRFNLMFIKIWTKRHQQLPGYDMGFPGSSVGKESAFSVGDLGLIPGLGRSPGEEKGYSL